MSRSCILSSAITSSRMSRNGVLPCISTANPAEQKEFVTQQFIDLKEQTVAIVPGNHCSNRTTKTAGLYPLYDCALLAGIGEKYRNIIAFLNIGVGTSKKDKRKQIHYFGQIQHKAKDCKNYGTSDFTDGIDFFAFYILLNLVVVSLA